MEILDRLDLDDDTRLLETIVNLHRHWPQLRDASGVDSPLDYLAAFEDNPAQQRALLESLDIDPAALAQLSQKFRKAYNDTVPPELQKLLESVGDFSEREAGSNPGLVRWQLGGDQRKQTGGAGDGNAASAGSAQFRLRGPGSAQVELEAGDLAPLAVHEPLLRIGFAGAVNKTSNGAATGAEIKLDAAVDARLDYWFAAAPERLFAGAAAESLRQLPSPFAPDSISEAAARGCRGLRLQLSAAIGASAAVEYSLFEGGKLVEATAGINVDASYRAKRDFALLVQCDHDNPQQLLVDIKRVRGREIDSSVGLGVQVDIAGAARQLRETVVEPRLGKFADIYAGFKPYLQPGTLLQQESSAALDDAVERLSSDAQIRTALRFALGGKADTAQLQRALSARLVRCLDSNVAVYARASDAGLGHDVADTLGGELSLPDAAREKLVAEVQTLVTALQDKLTAAVKQRADAASDTLVTELGALNQRVRNAMDTAATTLDKASAGVREALAQIDARIHTIARQLNAAAERKIKLRILSTEKSLRQRQATMRLRLDSHSTAAADFYRTLVGGRLEALDSLLTTPVNGIEIVSGSASELFGRHHSDGIELSLLGLSLGESSIVDSSVKIETDAAGNVAIQSQLAAKRVLDGIHETQSIGFLSQLKLRNLKRGRSLPLDLTVTQADERLELQELQRFLDSLSGCGLLSPGAAIKAVNAYRHWQSAGNRHINARVAAVLQIDGDYVQKLMDYAADSNSADGQKAMIADVLDALDEYGVIGSATVARACNEVRQISRHYRTLTSPVDLFAAFNVRMDSRDRPLAGRKAFFAEAFANSGDYPSNRATASRKLLQAREVHLFAKSWVVLMRKLQQIYTMDSAAASAASLEADNELMAFCLYRWLKVKRFFLTLPGDQVSTTARAFIGLLSRAAGLPAEYPLAVSMELVGEDSEPLLFW
ncbi:hypothetical protein [Microbulbifer sp. SAOS-129_SWC]|uniref:hypothetical protein n=1 Tax=Microbulbifer sp. SAOS-129_SWC TaxID=3145235 RepID=UPI0032164645